MKSYTCDRCGESVPAPELTTARLTGRGREALRRAELHLCVDCVPELAELVSIPTTRPSPSSTAPVADRRPAARA